MRRALVLVLLAATALGGGATRAIADDAAPAATRPAVTAGPLTAGPDDARATGLLETIAGARDPAARQAAIDALMKLAPTALGALDAWLARAHATSVGDRRDVLGAIKAAVPDKSGKFAAPPRQSGKERKADDDLDWLPKLLELDPARAGVGDVIADDVAIRALAATRDVRAAAIIFDTAFREGTMLYRDECGRYLRKMEPYSVPALTREAAGKNDRKRYATFQLERMDRQEPLKALSAAEGDEALMIAILDAFRETRMREAVHAVWRRVSDPRPRVREAARRTWTDYITGPPPPPAPKKKLQLTGGRLTKKEKPLWLTYRELADNELRLTANELLGEAYEIEDPSALDDSDDRPSKVEKIDLEQVTQRLYDHYDTERGKLDAAQWATAKAKADGGDLAAAIAMLDRLLAANPDRAERDAMAALYLAWAQQLEGSQKWAEAAAAFSTAHGLAPKGVHATDALAAHHYTLGKALEAQGKDGGADYRRAVALKPDYAPAQTAAQRVETAGRPTWMLYGAGLAALVAAALLGVGMLRRRA